MNTTADAKSVRDRLKNKSLPGWQRQRLLAVQLGLANKLSLPAIAEEAKTSARTVGTWFDTFRSQGLEGLLTRKPKGKGPASWLDAKTAQAFQAQLAKGRCLQTREARVWLESRLKRKLSLVVTYKYLARLRNGDVPPPEGHAGNHASPRQKGKSSRGGK